MQMTIAGRSINLPFLSGSRQKTRVIHNDDLLGFYGFSVGQDGQIAAVKAHSMSSTGMESSVVGAQVRAFEEFRVDKLQLALAVVSNPIAARCVDFSCRKIAEMPGIIRDKASGEEFPNHPLMEAFKLSRRYYRKDLFYVWQHSLYVHGEAFIEIVKNRLGEALTLRPLNPIAITPYIQFGEIDHFDYITEETQGKTTEFAPDELVYDIEHNPLDDLRGLSMSAIVIDDINLLNHIRRYQRGHFRNNARPGGLLVPKQNVQLRPADEDKLMNQWLERVRGADKSNRTILLPMSMEYHSVQEAPSPAHSEVERSAIQRICAGYGVPTSLIIFDELRFQVGDEHMSIFYEETVIPRSLDFQETINTDVLPHFDDSGKLEYVVQLDQVRTLLADELKRATALNSQVMTGVLSINEARVKSGNKPVQGGDIHYAPKAVTPVSADDLKDLPDIAREMEQQPQGQGAPATQQTPFNRGSQNERGARKAAFHELGQWRRAADRGLKRARDFNALVLPTAVSRSVHEMFHELPDDADIGARREVLDAAKGMLEVYLDNEAVMQVIGDVAEQAGLVDEDQEAS